MSEHPERPGSPSHPPGSGEPDVVVVGAGLAGCEAAWQAARRGLDVVLHEMKPEQYSPAHTSPDFAELVCSNSLRASGLGNAVGLLKEEMRRLGSLVMTAADETAVPAGKALAVDRVAFARCISEAIESHPRIRVARGVVERIPTAPRVILATGPLTAPALARDDVTAAVAAQETVAVACIQVRAVGVEDRYQGAPCLPIQPIDISKLLEARKRQSDAPLAQRLFCLQENAPDDVRRTMNDPSGIQKARARWRSRS